MKDEVRRARFYCGVQNRVQTWIEKLKESNQSMLYYSPPSPSHSYLHTLASSHLHTLTTLQHIQADLRRVARQVSIKSEWHDML